MVRLFVMHLAAPLLALGIARMGIRAGLPGRYVASLLLCAGFIRPTSAGTVAVMEPPTSSA
jgi:hypothetical protein